MSRYLARAVDPEMRDLLRATGCVVIEGVRGCGKTTTAREFSASEVLFDVDEDARTWRRPIRPRCSRARRRD